MSRKIHSSLTYLDQKALKSLFEDEHHLPVLSIKEVNNLFNEIVKNEVKNTKNESTKE